MTAYEYLDFDSFLTPDEVEFRKKLRKFLKEEIQPMMTEYHNKCEFAKEPLMKLVKEYPGLSSINQQGHKDLKQVSNSLAFAIFMEIFRTDISFAATYLHQTGLVMDTILSCGSQEQIDYYVPRLNNYSLLGSFNLTEPEHGSDATSLKTNAVKQGDHFIVNGHKRWAANVTVADFFVIWATYEGQIRGFIIDADSEGLTRSRIEGKLSFRPVQNGEVVLKNVKVPLKNLLPRGETFHKGTAKMLLSTRIGTGVAVTGGLLEAYDETVKYLSKRIQFGKPLTSFQMIQEKLVYCLSNIQSMIYFCKSVYDENQTGGVSMGKAALCKSYCTTKARETVRILRELWGGNGIISTNLVMRILADLESLHTYEGTYEINTLLAGREITGIAA
eukprot:CAMPEP_0170517494 /NCGR_PEP_ID=MMETSP0209-20121228/3472_1 /TAXON_ID=665100 ORGANISM="Litonotus pictus, Strain P1" /NCGR_SAMPLE_ID=MMETSP0209 /ASSEMBLY_ACC=CAM_ASM_000301 /LENGTH=387 /DNA_ID=CAMNT_0010802765 /DNA_START=64 /DNA_END=1223 /DNA_ORIENTATION=+